MDDDQQFCLRWNNHQSTLVAVFETLLANGILVDCTLAAEGKHLNAHKVVLSACSPYFEALLSKHFDKHPILILKDVKFQELEAMMDYMYKGEVNISQDQLGALLKAAESLQIKGLSDNRKGETERKAAPAPPPPKSPQPTAALPKVQGLTIEQRTRDDSREGSMSPGPRKKKRLRRKSEELDNHDASNSSESHSLPAQNIPSSLPATSRMNAGVPEPVETKSEILTRHKQEDIPQVPIIKEKLETHTELMLEPKSEYVEDMNEDSIEDLTLDDDDLSNMEQMDDQAGPSHGNAGEGSSQGFGGWHMGNQSQDEVFLAAQEAVGAHRDSQDTKPSSIQPKIKILKVEDLKNDDIVERIKKELSQQWSLSKSDSLSSIQRNKVFHQLPMEIDQDSCHVSNELSNKIVKPDPDDQKKIIIFPVCVTKQSPSNSVQKKIITSDPNTKSSEPEPEDQKKLRCSKLSAKKKISKCSHREKFKVESEEKNEVEGSLNVQIVRQREEFLLDVEKENSVKSTKKKLQSTISKSDSSHSVSKNLISVQSPMKVENSSEKESRSNEIPTRIVKPDPDEQKRNLVFSVQDKPVGSELHSKIIEKELVDQKDSNFLEQKNRQDGSPTKEFKLESDDETKVEDPVKRQTFRKTKDKISMERIKQFLSMAPENVTPKIKPKAKCLSAWRDIKKPLDTIRCVQCDVLYKRSVFLAHSKVCKGNKSSKKFRCASCTFTHTDLETLKDHVKYKHHE
ncbi:longitudinals lacking isoform X2 [Leptinotarsa decemlineata]|uniref:longitudinals lacking isoform X2 n=1 Tax=Leptinotarsa decemlineata TaxID=7539 RepID=UPI003D308C53